MQSFKRYYFVALTFIVSSLFSCSPPRALEYRQFKNLTIDKLGFNTSTVKMDVVFYNPNSFGLQLKSTDLDFYVDNNLVGHATELYQIAIPKKAEFTMPVQVDVDMKNIYRNALASLLTNQLLVKVTGTVQVGKAHIFLKFPVNYEGYQSYSMFK